MAKYIYGERIGKSARLRTGCSAVIFDEDRRVLLTRRADNGRWCLPSGGVDPGESVAETCIREVKEETGLDVRITRLIGVYSSPDMIIEYEDGNRWQLVALSFEAEIIGGQLQLSNETTGYGFYSVADMAAIDLIEPHRERITDALLHEEKTFIR